MDWEAIGAIGEVIGATGVIATLGYLAFQIRQNTISLRAGTLQTMLEASVGLTDLCASDPELGRIFVLGANSQSSLTEKEVIRFNFLMLSFLRRVENIYHQGRSGQVSESDWSGVKASSLGVLAQPGALEWWEENSYRFSEDFSEWASSELPTNAA